MNICELGGSRFMALWKFCIPKMTCFMLFWQRARLAASRTAWIAGNSNPMRMAMIVITTNNSTRVNPRFLKRVTMRHLLEKKDR